jgi:hypothetical protein
MLCHRANCPRPSHFAPRGGPPAGKEPRSLVCGQDDCRWANAQSALAVGFYGERCVPPDISPAKLPSTGGSIERENPLLTEHVFEIADVAVIAWLGALNGRVATRSDMTVENREQRFCHVMPSETRRLVRGVLFAAPGFRQGATATEVRSVCRTEAGCAETTCCVGG